MVWPSIARTNFTANKTEQFPCEEQAPSFVSYTLPYKIYELRSHCRQVGQYRKVFVFIYAITIDDGQCGSKCKEAV